MGVDAKITKFSVKIQLSSVETTTVIVDCAVYRTDGQSPLISESCLSQPAWTTTTNRREQNLIVCSGKSEAEVTNNRSLHSMYCNIDGIGCTYSSY